jgi:hypothetical protein
MFELGLVLIGVILGAGSVLGYDLAQTRKKIKALEETLQADWNLRQIGGAVKQPRGYDPLEQLKHYEIQQQWTKSYPPTTVTYPNSVYGSTTNGV